MIGLFWYCMGLATAGFYLLGEVFYEASQVKKRGTKCNPEANSKDGFGDI